MSTTDDTQIREGDEAVAQTLGRLAESEIGDDVKTAAFIGQLMSQNYRNYAATTQTLIGSLEADNARLRAELDAVRGLIEQACSKPWTPSTGYILSCLYPSAEAVRAMESEGAR